MSSVILEIDSKAQKQHQVANYRYTADFFLPGTKTIIEINGPSHYLKRIVDGKITVTDQLNGRTRIKEQNLLDQGYKLVTINYQEFAERKSREEMLALVNSKLHN